jgi:hypothetical protein
VEVWRSTSGRTISDQGNRLDQFGFVSDPAIIQAIKKAGANTRTDLPALLSALAPVHPWSPTKTML